MNALWPQASSEALLWLSSFLLLYPEIHYVFKYFPFSRYRRKEPEILTDAPYRVNPGQPIPLMLLIKDAHRYPVHVHTVSIKAGSTVQSVTLTHRIEEKISIPLWSKTLFVSPPNDFSDCPITLDTTIDYSVNGRRNRTINHNLPQLSQRPLQTLLARESLPGLPRWVYGDLHYHSSYTDDQVEFGAPLTDTIHAARAIGLGFFAVTDHSYDLDDRADNFLIQDPTLPKWKSLQEEIRRHNATRSDVIVLPGEEVTCANAGGRNVHCLVLNSSRYLPGSGDGAERWFRTDSELSISEIPERAEPDALIIASHPKEPAPLLERLLIRRGSWSHDDCSTPGLAGLQILNGAVNDAFFSGMAQWRRQLANGSHVYIYAGNDAHGNFNRYRQVSTPMWSLVERDHYQRFGWAKTCIYAPNPSLASVIEALRRGQCFITTGPFLMMEVADEAGRRYGLGETCSGRAISIHLEGRSTEEFGRLTDVRIFHGVSRKERCLIHRTFGSLTLSQTFPLESQCSGYVRAEIKTDHGFFAVTNPIWL
jgi:hypothetical protein